MASSNKIPILLTLGMRDYYYCTRIRRHLKNITMQSKEIKVNRAKLAQRDYIRVRMHMTQHTGVYHMTEG